MGYYVWKPIAIFLHHINQVPNTINYSKPFPSTNCPKVTLKAQTALWYSKTSQNSL